MEKKREMGIDFLRIVLMYMIIIGHLLTHTNIRTELPAFEAKWFFAWGIQSLTICAVNCFVIISGYFGVQGKYDSFKAIKLWVKVLFYSVVMTIVAVCISHTPINKTLFLNALFPILREEYWFITSYLLLFLLIPFINILINKLNFIQLRMLGTIVIISFFVRNRITLRTYPIEV